VAKQLDVNLDLPGEEISAVIDPDRIQQVVWNLLSNAIKFTPPSGRISIRLEQHSSPESSMLSLQVIDTGQGIDPKFLPYVFDRFRQADSTSTRSHGGLGIGLAIVRHIVEQHGGTVGAASDGPGQGATFTIQLPLARPAAVSVPPIFSPSSGPAAFERLDAIRVLLVDDEADAREVIATTLRRAGAIVATADSAAKALANLESFRPDVLLSDIGMPDQDGYALIQQIRQSLSAEYSDLPAIALTAYAREEDSARALAAGFQAHLAKPVDPAELVRRIAKWATRLDIKSVTLKLA
jgi:CheY-like chemotaxis protein